jgi:hypothetical protein
LYGIFQRNLLTGVPMIGLAIIGCAAGDANVPASRPTTKPEVDFFLGHAETVRLRLVSAGVGDKTVPALIVGVGASPADLHEVEYENGDPNGRRIAVLCAISVEEMKRILSATASAGLLDDAHAWDTDTGDPSSRFIFNLAVPEAHLTRQITGAGAAELRRVVRQHLRADNKQARHALDLAGG